MNYTSCTQKSWVSSYQWGSLLTQLSNETQPVRQTQAGKQGEGIHHLGFLKDGISS